MKSEGCDTNGQTGRLSWQGCSFHHTGTRPRGWWGWAWGLWRVWQWLCLEETHAGLSEGTVTGTHYGITFVFLLIASSSPGKKKKKNNSAECIYACHFKCSKCGGEFEATPWLNTINPSLRGEIQTNSIFFLWPQRPVVILLTAPTCFLPSSSPLCRTWDLLSRFLPPGLSTCSCYLDLKFLVWIFS